MLILLPLFLSIAYSNECTTEWQSPIDLVTPFVYEDLDIDFYFGYQSNAVMYRNDYNLKIDGDFGGFRYRDSYFQSTDIVFKSPSEHMVNGKRYPMEMQIHHMDKEGNHAYVAAFFRESTESDFLNGLGFGNPNL
jgi:carbonic anhydrase